MTKKNQDQGNYKTVEVENGAKKKTPVEILAEKISMESSRQNHLSILNLEELAKFEAKHAEEHRRLKRQVFRVDKEARELRDTECQAANDRYNSFIQVERDLRDETVRVAKEQAEATFKSHKKPLEDARRKAVEEAKAKFKKVNDAKLEQGAKLIDVFLSKTEIARDALKDQQRKEDEQSQSRLGLLKLELEKAQEKNTEPDLAGAEEDKPEETRVSV